MPEYRRIACRPSLTCLIPRERGLDVTARNMLATFSEGNRSGGMNSESLTQGIWGTHFPPIAQDAGIYGYGAADAGGLELSQLRDFYAGERDPAAQIYR